MTLDIYITNGTYAKKLSFDTTATDSKDRFESFCRNLVDITIYPLACESTESEPPRTISYGDGQVFYETSKVNHPDHYAKGRKFEPIDVIEDWELNFHLGNALKYISRAGRKGDYLEDLKKAFWYLEREICRCQE